MIFCKKKRKIILSRCDNVHQKKVCRYVTQKKIERIGAEVELKQIIKGETKSFYVDRSPNKFSSMALGLR